MKYIFLAVFLIAGISTSAFAQKATKEISKSYAASKGFTLDIANKYGKIDVVNWDKNEVDVKVTITVEANNQEKAEETLKYITVEIDESGNGVSFETEFDSKAFGKNQNIEVAYKVTAPEYINASLAQKYGSVYIQSLTGDVELEIKYGELTASSIVNSNRDAWNTLEFAYSEGSIDQAGNLEAEVSYSELELTEVNMLNMESKYSEFTGEYIGGMELESKYDEFAFDEVVDLSAEMKYGAVHIGQLNNSLNITAEYTNVNLDIVLGSFSSLVADLSYGDFKGKLDKGASFKVEAAAAYGSVALPEGNLEESREGVSEKVSGTIGNVPKATVDITLKYGDLVLK